MHWTVTTAGINLSVIMCPEPRIALIEDIQKCFLMNGQVSLGQSSFPGGLSVKNLPAMQETWVQSLGREDPLEKEMATHSGILA